MATNNVEDFNHSTHLLGATTLRNVLGTKCLAEILSEREQIAHWMEATLDDATDPWGVKVERVEIKDVRLPVQLQRAMAAEAEAAREARAKVIAAEGEQKASRALREASDMIAESPSALQLRYLQDHLSKTTLFLSSYGNRAPLSPSYIGVLTRVVGSKLMTDTKLDISREEFYNNIPGTARSTLPHGRSKAIEDSVPPPPTDHDLRPPHQSPCVPHLPSFSTRYNMYLKFSAI